MNPPISGVIYSDPELPHSYCLSCCYLQHDFYIGLHPSYGWSIGYCTLLESFDDEKHLCKAPHDSLTLF